MSDAPNLEEIAKIPSAGPCAKCGRRVDYAWEKLMYGSNVYCATADSVSLVHNACARPGDFASAAPSSDGGKAQDT